MCKPKIQQKDTNECTYNYFILIHDDNPSPQKKQHYTSMISQRIFPSHFCGARPEASRRSLPSAARRALNWSASGEIHRVLRKFLCNIRSQKTAWEPSSQLTYQYNTCNIYIYMYDPICSFGISINIQAMAIVEGNVGRYSMEHMGYIYIIDIDMEMNQLWIIYL